MDDFFHGERGLETRFSWQRADARQANASWMLVVRVKLLLAHATRAMTHLRYSPSRQLALTG